MAAPKTSTTAPTAWTAQQVLEMFAELGLPVCDDGALIEEKFKAKRNYYLKLLKSPEPNVHLKGELGVKNGEALLNRRADLLRVVQGLYNDLAGAALAAAGAAGVTTLTAALKKSLLAIAVQQCRTDEALGQVFLKEFLAARGISDAAGGGDRFVWPATLTGFRAESRQGQVVLSWDVPAENCDAVEVLREEEPPADGRPRAPRPEPRPVYRGRGGATVNVPGPETGMAEGRWYRYRAHALFQDVAGPDSVERAVCVAEIGRPAAVWADGCVALTWAPPNPEVSVLIFRREGAAPQLRVGTGGAPQAADGAEQVHAGWGKEWADRDPKKEGSTWFYRLVADFGQGLYSQGVVVQVKVPRLPPPPARATATFRPGDKGGEVELNWSTVTFDSPVEYVVVRREGDAAPAGPADGAVIATVSESPYADSAVVPGARYCYAVFTRAGGLLSRKGARAGPVDVLTEVGGLKAETADATVELAWQTPANVRAVLVRRDECEPRDHRAGVAVKLTALAPRGHAKDEGLTNGKQYHYLVCCVYRPGGQEVVTPGVRIEATPEELPDPVGDFKAGAVGNEVHCTWTPARDQVVLRRSAQPPAWIFGQRLPAADVFALGENVTTEHGQAKDGQPDVAQPYYSIFTVAGSHAVFGGSRPCAVCPDVTDLKASLTQDGVILRWAWPPGCTAVRVARRAGAWPEGPDDPRAAVTEVGRTEYAAAGDKFVQPLKGGRARLHYVVYARASGAPGVFFAPGAGVGCRQEVQWGPWMMVRYRLAPASGREKGKALRLSWAVESPLPDFAGFALVASEKGVPSSPEEGVTLFTWVPKEGAAEGAHEAAVSLAPVRQRGWARFYCKAVACEPAQRPATLFVHPNTTVPFSAAGAAIDPRQGQGQGGYDPRVPRTVVCPTGFEEFPVEEMLFADYAGGEPRRGRHTWLDRLLRHPPQPPVNEQGQRLSRKLCPNKHDLPFTAGTQGNLVIGLLGAVASGKSHYIAALVQRLLGVVGQDLSAALMPVTDETRERYRREFYEPLFNNHFPLGATAGVPPPLVYDLTLDGKLWGWKQPRSVTLSLYDTAGENLRDPRVLRQMLKYLGVASAVLLLVDPLQLPAVRDALPAALRPAAPPAGGGGPDEIINLVLPELEKRRLASRAGPLSTPVAVVMTKCDVLRDAGLLEPNRLWATDARHVGYFDREAHEDMTGMFAELVQRWCPAVHTPVTTRFARHAFFGVSATGCAPARDTNRYRYVAPWRVEDPLLWLLYELGVLPGRDRPYEPAEETS